MAKFENCIDYVIKNEGGYSDNPNDLGGPTKWGITISTLSAWRGRLVQPIDVEHMIIEEAKSIYKKHYWNVIGLDKVDRDNVATCLLDIGVNRGCSKAKIYAQTVCKDVGFNIEIDGILGPKSFKAINAVNPKVFIEELERLVEQGYQGIVARNPSQSVFLKGWLNRAKRMLTLI